MRVLAEPNENPNLPKMVVSCTGKGMEKKGCGRLLEVSFVDIQKGTYNSYGETEGYYYIVCPVCGRRTEVYYNEMPKEFRGLV